MTRYLHKFTFYNNFKNDQTQIAVLLKFASFQGPRYQALADQRMPRQLKRLHEQKIAKNLMLSPGQLH